MKLLRILAWMAVIILTGMIVFYEVKARSYPTEVEAQLDFEIKEDSTIVTNKETGETWEYER